MRDGLAPRPLIIVGAGGHGAVVGDCVDPAQFTLIGYIDERRPIGSTVIRDQRVIGRFDDLPKLTRLHDGLAGVVALGDNSVRRCIVERAKQAAPNLRWSTIVHRSAIISPSSLLGPGCVIAPGVIVNCRTRLGQHVLINTGSIIEHDNVFGDFASAGPGVVTGGAVEVGEFTHLGIAATIKHGIRIGAHCVVGGQAYVDRPVDDGLVSYGVPARARQQREPGAAYL